MATSFFVSYTGADERWAEWIAWQLEQAGYTVRIQAWDFRPGSNFVLEMQKAASECDRTLIVLSPAYLNSAFAAPEWAAAFVNDPTGAKRKLVPVRVAECTPEGILKSIVYIDLVGLDEDAARKKLLAGVQEGRAKPTTAPTFPGGAKASTTRTRTAPVFPGTLPPVWAVPFPPNPHFTGREELLDALHKNLGKRIAAITQPQAVHGLGGVGKTQLAAEYAWKYRAEYDAVLWVAADSPENASANLAALVKPDVLNLPEAEAKEQDVQVAAVRRWLRQHERWLLVFDSVDRTDSATSVRDMIAPTLPGHVIVISRLTNWPVTISSFSVDTLPIERAADFLCERTHVGGFLPGVRDDALVLARELGGLPLALEQAAAYMLHHRTTFAVYIKRLKDMRPQLLGERVEGGTLYPRSVVETWLVSEQQLSLVARAILRLAAFLAPDDIPRDLFAKGGKRVLESVHSLALEEGVVESFRTESLDIEAGLIELADHSLVTLASIAFSCHRLVQAVQSDRLTDKLRRRWIELTLRLVNEYAPSDSDDVRAWPVWEVLRAHAEIVASQAYQLGIPKLAARLMNQLGVFLQARALYREAEPLMRQALAIDEQTYGFHHPNVAACLNNLAALLQDTNRLAEAEALMRRALAIDEQAYSPNHPTIANRLSNLAEVLKAANRLAEAEPLMRRALVIAEQSYGPDHPNVATCLNNLAQLLQDTNRLTEAEPLMRRALTINEQAYGFDHPSVAACLNNLARLLRATNRLVEAEPLYRRALAIAERLYGLNHPNVATCLNNLAKLLQDANRLAEAELLYRRALAIDEKVYGPDHPHVAIRLGNLATLLQATNRLGEAEPLIRRALAIDEQADHPDIAIDLNNLATLLNAMGRSAEAEPLIRRAVIVFREFRESTGHEHPHMQATIENYSELLKAMGLPDEEIRRRVSEAAGE